MHQLTTSQKPKRASQLRLEIVNDKTIITTLEEFLPECYLEQDKRPSLPTVVCLQRDNACDKGSICVPALARRVHVIFNAFSNVRLLVLLFKRREQKPTFAIIVPRTFNLRIVRCNPTGLAIVRKKAKIVRGNLPPGFY